MLTSGVDTFDKDELAESWPRKIGPKQGVRDGSSEVTTPDSRPFVWSVRTSAGSTVWDRSVLGTSLRLLLLPLLHFGTPGILVENDWYLPRYPSVFTVQYIFAWSRSLL